MPRRCSRVAHLPRNRDYCISHLYFKKSQKNQGKTGKYSANLAKRLEFQSPGKLEVISNPGLQQYLAASGEESSNPVFFKILKKIRKK